MKKSLFRLIVFTSCLTLVSFCQGTKKSDNDKGNSKETNMRAFKLSSPAFKDGEDVPVKYTCDGEDVSPALQWTGAPDGTKSFTLIYDDPDAPMGTWVHWVLFNINPTVTSLPEGFGSTRTHSLKDEKFVGIVDGLNDFRQLGYGGPCPPKGPAHRYFFKLYALDTALNLKTGATKSDVEKAMTGHILAEAELLGKYKR